MPDEEVAGMIAKRPASPVEIVYPESDGEPMADNTKQARWIVVIYGGLCALFRERPDVFVSMNLFWYPEEGHPEVRTAPDVYVVFGRPKGDRASYQQWLEANLPPQVVFEILSPGNSGMEMMNKLMFYEDHGVEEYYIYDPDTNELAVYLRQGTVLSRVRKVRNWTSPRLGIRFDMTGPELVIYRPDGERFRPFEEVMAVWKQRRRTDCWPSRRVTRRRNGPSRPSSPGMKQRSAQSKPRTNATGRRRKPRRRGIERPGWRSVCDRPASTPTPDLVSPSSISPKVEVARPAGIILPSPLPPLLLGFGAPR